MYQKLIFLLLLSTNSIFAQIDFDYQTHFKEILTQSTDSTGLYFYPNLLERFNRNDSTLVNFEILALQIGFTENKNYKPYQILKTERKIKSLVADEEFEEAIRIADSVLLTNPLNFTALLEKGFSLMKLEKDAAAFHKGKVMKVVRAILSSGDGTREKPYFVLGPGDGITVIEYILGGSIGTAGSGNDDNGNFLEIIEMITEEETKKTYFNINHATQKMFKN